MALIIDNGSRIHIPREPAPTPPPANPDDAGLTRSTSVERGPNGFELGIEGPDPDLAAGGTHDQQETQRDKTVALALLALTSYTTGNTGLPRTPPDSEVTNVLSELQPNPPIGEDGDEVTRAVYQSEIPNLTAEEGYAHFVDNPNEVFNAGGMEIRPPTDSLVDGGRYMLEIGTPVPTWLPIQIGLDPATNAVSIQTLDGHVLRGEQTFTFTDNGNGGTTLTQDASFQASSVLPRSSRSLQLPMASTRRGRERIGKSMSRQTAIAITRVWASSSRRAPCLAPGRTPWATRLPIRVMRPTPASTSSGNSRTGASTCRDGPLRVRSTASAFPAAA